MKPAKFAYAAASLALAFVRPPVARLLVVTVAAVIGFVAFWADREPAALFGTVSQVQVAEASGQTFFAVDPWWPGAAQEVASIAPEAVQTTIPQVGDLIMAFGFARPVTDPERVRARQVLEVTDLGVLPITFFEREVADRPLQDRVAGSSPWLVIAVTTALALYANLALRLGASAVFAGLSTLAVFLVLRFSQQDGLLPVPGVMHEPILIAAAAAGAALAFKAMIGESWKIGQRGVAIILSLALTPFLQDTLVLPDVLALGWPVLSFLFPVLPVLALSAAMITIALSVDPQEGWAVLGLLAAIRLAARWEARPATAAILSTGKPDVDPTGRFDIENLIVNKRGR